LVIGIERNNQRILNPDSNTVFEWGDVLWIVGDRDKIQKLTSDIGPASNKAKNASS
jgi:CPA2 family monovalent cation:H+ antiporter-2